MDTVRALEMLPVLPQWTFPVLQKNYFPPKLSDVSQTGHLELLTRVNSDSIHDELFKNPLPLTPLHCGQRAKWEEVPDLSLDLKSPSLSETQTY